MSDRPTSPPPPPGGYGDQGPRPEPDRDQTQRIDQPGYGQQRDYSQAPAPAYGEPQERVVAAKNGAGTAALVVGIIAILICLIPYLGVLLALIAVILGLVGRRRARRGVATNGGAALTGLVLGVIALIVGLIVSVAATFFGFAIFDAAQDCSETTGLTQQELQECIEDGLNIPGNP